MYRLENGGTKRLNNLPKVTAGKGQGWGWNQRLTLDPRPFCARGLPAVERQLTPKVKGRGCTASTCYERAMVSRPWG